jgi:hypothetical protein
MTGLLVLFCLFYGHFVVFIFHFGHFGPFHFPCFRSILFGDRFFEPVTKKLSILTLSWDPLEEVIKKSYLGGLRSTEEAFLLPTQQPQVRMT